MLNGVLIVAPKRGFRKTRDRLSLGLQVNEDYDIFGRILRPLWELPSGEVVESDSTLHIQNPKPYRSPNFQH